MLECPICHKQFTVDGTLQPKILKCGHTICSSCSLDASHAKKNHIKCPFCYRITPFGIMGTYALPVNKTLVDIISLHESLKGDATPVDLCCSCKERPAEKICFSCDPAGCKLCEQCCDAEHNCPFGPVRNHKPLNINEVKAVAKNFCVKHNQPLTHCSKKVADFVCEKCLTELDDKAEYVLIEVAGQALTQRLPKVMGDLNSYLKRQQDAQHKMELMLMNLGVIKPNIMQEIQKKFSRYQIIFQKRHNSLIDNLETEVSGIA